METYVFSLAPLQGITDFAFRNLICRHFSGIDKVYSPFLRLQNDKTLKNSQLKDILPENNEQANLIPQVLCNDANDFVYLANFLSDFGYKEINWNLGCPYPMVAKRKLGSGLLPFPDLIDQLLNELFEKFNGQLSVKLRAGYENEGEIFEVLPVLNRYPLSEIIIHPRIGKQMYKGDANQEIIHRCMEKYNGMVAYNGDIQTTETFGALKAKLPEIGHWMIGRALISNPFLTEEIKYGQTIDANTKMERFSSFHYDLYEYYCQTLSGPGHILNKMQHLWEYFSKSFSNCRKVHKRIKKSTTLEKFNAEIHYIFNNEGFAG